MYSWNHRIFVRKKTLGFQLLFFSGRKAALTLPFIADSYLPKLLLEICNAYESTSPVVYLLKCSITGTIRKVSLVFLSDTSGYYFFLQSHCTMKTDHFLPICSSFLPLLVFCIHWGGLLLFRFTCSLVQSVFPQRSCFLSFWSFLFFSSGQSPIGECF